MKRFLNTLYVTSQGSYLAKQGETVLIRVDNETKLQVPIHNLDGIVCFGRVSCSPFLMDLCCKNDVSISFLSENGRFFARVQGPTSGNVLLRREQYRRADNPDISAAIARNIVLVKIANSRTVLLRALRDNPEEEYVSCISRAEKHLAEEMKKLPFQKNLDSIRGIEGDAAKTYFSVFNNLITTQKDHFVFCERNRRPPLDNVNALLSFLYTLVAHDVSSALEGVGLDSAVGFLHRDRPGRTGLALDMMEEFRPFLADRLALSLVNRKQIKGDGFKKTESGAILMDDHTRKKVLTAYQERKKKEIQHPFIGEKISFGLLPHIQAMLFSRYIRNDLDEYPPFRWR